MRGRRLAPAPGRAAKNGPSDRIATEIRVAAVARPRGDPSSPWLAPIRLSERFFPACSDHSLQALHPRAGLRRAADAGPFLAAVPESPGSRVSVHPILPGWRPPGLAEERRTYQTSSATKFETARTSVAA